MGMDNNKKKSFFATLPGILTGLAALITALTGLYLALHDRHPTAQVRHDPKSQPTQQPKLTPQPPVLVNINGTWYSDEGLSYVITQSGNNIYLEEINPLYGTTASGQGTISGQDVDISVTTAAGTQGRARFRVSDDGEELIGEYTDITRGMSMPLDLYR
jgi:hypothetical protein